MVGIDRASMAINVIAVNIMPKQPTQLLVPPTQIFRNCVCVVGVYGWHKLYGEWCHHPAFERAQHPSPCHRYQSLVRTGG